MAFLEVLESEQTLFLTSFVNTLMLFLCAGIMGLILATVGLYVLERDKGFFSILLKSFIGLMRMTPFLAIAYLLFYGLPEIGIRLEAWSAGLVSLLLYHGAYFTEILRTTRISLPPADLEAANSLGLSRWTSFSHITLPQTLLRARLLLGNQFIVCLKDTAFLSIITVIELTTFANTISGNYLMVLEPFTLIILCYWGMTLCIELLVKLCGQYGLRRGLEHG